MAHSLPLDTEHATTVHQWHDVRRRLTRVAECGSTANIFGSNGHQWHLEPPLSITELCEIENQLSVRLPDDYRSFLLQCSRGGAGPHYGIFPLRKANGRWHWEEDCPLNDLTRLNEPFPHIEACNPIDLAPEEPKKDNFRTEESYKKALGEWQKQWDEIVYNPNNATGFLYLSHIGCSLREGIVVTGPAKGLMWIDRMADRAGYKPLTDDDGKPLTFAGWYTRWLDGVEKQLRVVTKTEEEMRECK